MSERERMGLRRDTIAFIFQSFGLIPMLSAAENVGIPLRITGMRSADRDQRVAMMLEIVGLSEHAAHRPDELSGGQQQRIAIARALAGRPQLLIADEPTAEQDAVTREVVLARMFAIASDGGAIILATHDPEVADRCDRVVSLARHLPTHA
jgi:putative ABC transport system ATP-binding protein